VTAGSWQLPSCGGLKRTNHQEDADEHGNDEQRVKFLAATLSSNSSGFCPTRQGSCRLIRSGFLPLLGKRSNAQQFHARPASAIRELVQAFDIYAPRTLQSRRSAAVT
jgi:hypothetical protein